MLQSISKVTSDCTNSLSYSMLLIQQRTLSLAACFKKPDAATVCTSEVTDMLSYVMLLDSALQLSSVSMLSGSSMWLSMPLGLQVAVQGLGWMSAAPAILTRPPSETSQLQLSLRSDH